MILEDIKEQIVFPNLIKQQFINTRKNIIPRKCYHSVKNKKINTKRDNENDISFSSISEEYFQTLPLFRASKKSLNKKTETNKINNKNKILNLKQNEETKYDIERNKYYIRNISRRMKLFFGKKKK